MMPQSYHVWYCLVSRVLLVCFLMLNVVGFSWHLHNHHRSDAIGSGFAGYSDAYFSADEACSLCDWLTQQTYFGATLLHPEVIDKSSDIWNNATPQSAYFFGLHQNQSSRAPPSQS
ncbi:hypothetical protein [Tunicatimonas pelagia]|uniref:hypothetical protein n=1 Tax=Tunicatimonas pelagia TaxID=931531 RepID=UPI0026670FCB|nr:hypothetical protein [Tunicatimonas pelagia]WKN44336.1 hypothetical protein P0M28_05080 [Tunicatimonas pelagia]